MNKLLKILGMGNCRFAVMLVAGMSMFLAQDALGARTMTLTQVNRTGRAIESFDFAFGGDAGGVTYALYMAYGSADGGYDIQNWEHRVKLADVAPSDTEKLAVAVPAEVVGDAQLAKFFLCEDFKELDYIRSVGEKQIIDTGVTPTAATRVTIDCQLMALTGNTGACCLFGVRKYQNDLNRKFVYWFTLDGGNIYPAINWGTADSGYLKTAATKMNGAFHVISNDGASLLLDGEAVYSNAGAVWGEMSGYSMVLFGLRDNGVAGSRKIEARVRSMSIVTGNTLQRDYVAVERVGGKAGLYDRVNKKMYYAAEDFSTADRGAETGVWYFNVADNLPAMPVKFSSRTVGVSRVNQIGGMDVSADLAFGGEAHGATHVLYVAYGETDAGENPRAWEHLQRVTEVGPEVAELDSVPLPPANCARFFLCNEYEQIEYITSGEGQIIDTGVVPTGTMSVTLDWQVVSDKLAANAFSPVFGLRYNAASNWKFVWWLQKIVDDNKKVFIFPALNWGTADSGYQVSNSAQVNVARNLLKLEPGNVVSFSVNGVKKWEGAATFGTADPHWTLLLFGLRTDGAGGSDVRGANYGVRVHGMNIDDGEVAVRDCVPAVLNGRAGLYDRVQEAFYTARDGADFTGAARGRACGTILEAAAVSPVQPLTTASAATGAARPLAVVPKTYAANGALASVTVTFPEGEGLGTLALYAVYGATAGGDTVESWERSEKLGDIAGTTTSLDYTMPEGWGTTYRFLRFVYKPEESTLPAFFDSSVTPVAFLASDGSQQKIQVPKRVYAGEKFTIKWRQYAVDVLHLDEDKGFQFGYDNAHTVSGGGRHSFNASYLEEVSPYIFNGHRGFAPKLYLSEVTTNDVFVDTIRLTSPLAYEKVRLSDGKVWQLAANVNTAANYDSSGDIYLFCGSNGHHGRKAIYSARAFTTAGHLSVNLVPVVKNGVPGYYDSVGGVFFANSGSGTFIVGDNVDLKRGASALICAAEQEIPVFGEVAHSGQSSGDSFSVDGTLARTGGGSAAMTVQYSTTPDYSTVVELPAGNVAADGGAFTATVTAMRPGTTVFWRAKAVNATSGATVYTAWTAVEMEGPTELGSLSNLKSIGLEVTPGAFSASAGFGTTYLWIAWGSTPECQDGMSEVQVYPNGTPITFSDKLQMSAYGDYYYCLVASNECSTASTVVKGEPVLHTVNDNVTYTWCGGAEGTWNEAVNWTKSGPSVAGYPNSTVCAVVIPEAESPVITLGGAMAAQSFSVAAGGTYVIQGVPEGGDSLSLTTNVALGNNTKLTFKDCSVAAVSFAAKKADSELVFSNAVVATVPSDNDCLAAGGGGKIVIDDSQVTTKSVYFNSDGNNSEYVIKGRKTVVRVKSNMRSAMNYSGGLLRFVVPDGGFDSTPIVADVSTANQFAWFNTWPANANYSFTLMVDPSSPALMSGRSFTQPLVDWSAVALGIKKSNLSLGTFARPTGNRFEFDDDTDTPKFLYFVHEVRSTVIFVR